MKQFLLILFLALIAIAAYFGFMFYTNMFSINTPSILENEELFIPTGSTVEDVIDSLMTNGQILNENHFRWTAGKMSYSDDNVKRGRYIITASSTSRSIISMLRGAKQAPLKVTINNVRTIEQLAGRIATRLEFDSLDLKDYLNHHFDSIAGTTPPTRLTRFLPNTYEFYWTVSPEEYCIRMLKEYERFWTPERQAKAEKIGFTTEQVYTLASIIEKETNYNPEKPRMAGVYLNRIRDSIPLQADPTIVFALGQFDLKRILYGHLEVDSPYNTYKNLGLPPGPIYMPGMASINAVLDKEDHNFLYFCARPTEDGPGHAYAETLPAHHQNAQRYQNWLNTRGIY
ncbi:MAG TPA: endolytic transglycosylase MltG [Saprospiraceae bacterium]|nr:endolytic transglycosylase MltG [Saprospiraceae bacterium]